MERLLLSSLVAAKKPTRGLPLSKPDLKKKTRDVYIIVLFWIIWYTGICLLLFCETFFKVVSVLVHQKVVSADAENGMFLD